MNREWFSLNNGRVNALLFGDRRVVPYENFRGVGLLVNIDEKYFFPFACESGRESNACGCFACAAFLCGY